VRSGWTGSARCSPIVWGGDPTVDWGFDGLSSAVTNGLTMGLSGVSTWGSDIGGFFAFFDRRLSPELLVRWIQFGAVSGVMRLQATGIPAPPAQARAQAWEPEVLPHWRRWTKLRTQLFPYVEAADAEYRRSGLPIMRHLALAYRDRRSSATDDAFLFGPDLLAAPITGPGQRLRSLHLPPGRWIDLWRSAAYVPSDGSLRLGRSRVLRGGRATELAAPLEELPLLVRAGALLPLLPPDVDTLSSYGDAAATVSLAERAGERRLLSFPRGRSSARIGASGGRLASSERARGWVLRFDQPASVRWSVQASLGVMHRSLTPCRVELDGRPLPRRAWSFDRQTKVLSVRLRVRSGRMTASAC
jgi:alpha-glucosidase (family GH31 glycosyl hydrolase)